MTANTRPGKIDADTGFMGVLMLDTRFARPLGDIGNPLTFAELGIPVRYATVTGASPQPIVQQGDPVHGVAPGCEFQRRILGNAVRMNLAQAREDVVQAARQLVSAHPGITDIVFECTNMPPYRQAVMDATGRPVVDIMTVLQRAWSERLAAR